MKLSVGTFALLYLSSVYAAAIGARQSAELQALSLTVDLGYSIYKGAYNSGTGLRVWKGYVS